MKLLNALSLNMYDADLFPVAEKNIFVKRGFQRIFFFPVHCDRRI